MGALSREQQQQMLAAGFSPQEIRDINRATTPSGEPQKFDYHAPAVQRMITSRNIWKQRSIAQLTAAGYSPDKIARIIRGNITAFYRRNRDMTIFDFLKDEYKVDQRMKGIGISPEKMKATADKRSAISRHFGKDYGTYTPDNYTVKPKKGKLPKRYTLGMND